MADVILVGLITGTLIGTVGIGGILLSPLLTYLLGIELHLAMASSSFSFLFTGVIGTVSYAKRGSISWEMVKWLSLGIIPATILGAKINTILSTNLLTIVLAVLIILSGFNVLYKPPPAGSADQQLSRPGLVLLGLGVGFGSALTGTGGPVLLVPLLVFMKFSPLAAIGVSQAIQLPVAAFATLGFFLYGQIDMMLGISLGLIQAIGVALGAKIAHNLPFEKLRQLVALALIGVGGLMIWQTFV
jgi:uncharacterized membrane protein YfcA